MTTSTALLLADLAGVAVFAASGASAAVAKRLDLFGVVFVGFVAALGGGIVRDLVIDEVPPLAFADWRYATTAAVTAGAIFWLHPQFARLRTTVLVLDAAGLGLFTVAGTLKALDAQVPPVGACLIGMITAIGGGLCRDLLTGEIPVVLRREIYAVAALAGSIVVVLLDGLGYAGPIPLVAAVLLVFGVRLVALRRRWSAPVAALRPPPRTGGITGPPD
ncbi:trimeric intracellular cation channel family protein [Verrucosispora sp. FIM060022]|uniref:trimeric intracellular cation channel family protein n=1 Tax=Verrucosispora sp. FIM060022 TaxID=1479020 RepID=UPI000F8640BB|nr:trimeric intracellular cation channel family protein [Verrucosispora sp. FIM060022]RUL91770.1 trimeric intracellular cation channel family protein [Verrucosispora sp. FIM060022]